MREPQVLCLRAHGPGGAVLAPYPGDSHKLHAPEPEEEPCMVQGGEGQGISNKRKSWGDSGRQGGVRRAEKQEEGLPRPGAVPEGPQNCKKLKQLKQKVTRGKDIRGTAR